MKVWLVEYHDYDSDRVSGVFSTEEKAKGFWDALGKDGQVNSTIKSYEVDPGATHGQ